MITIEDVQKSYSGNAALKGVDLSLSSGELMTLIGPNGSGKSTLVNILAGLIPKDKGVLRLNKKEIDRNQLVKKVNVGFVLEKPILIERFSVEEFLEFTGFLQKMDRQVVKSRIEDLCELLDLKAKKSIEDLSNGQKMKVAISAALIHNPDYLIMDEPFNGVDFKSTRIIGQILRKKVQSGASVMLTSHQYDIILELSDRIAVLKNGRVDRILGKQEMIDELEFDPESDTVKDKMIGLMGYDEPMKLPDWF